MEGQSEDCPFLDRVTCRRSGCGPQWRGSRKTARFAVPDTEEDREDEAAMEGQSEDCPFPRSNR